MKELIKKIKFGICVAWNAKRFYPFSFTMGKKEQLKLGIRGAFFSLTKSFRKILSK